VSADDQRFLVNNAVDNMSTPSIIVVTNWMESLKK